MISELLIFNEFGEMVSLINTDVVFSPIDRVKVSSPSVSSSARRRRIGDCHHIGTSSKP